MKFLRWIPVALLWFCVGTVLAEGVLLGMLWWKGAFEDDRVLAMYAALHGIHPDSPAAVPVAAPDPNPAQMSLAEVAQQRMLTSLDLDLRENTLDKSLAELRNLEEKIRVEDKRLTQWKMANDSRLAQLEGTTLSASLLEVQKTLEAIQPKQAKEQILNPPRSKDRGARHWPAARCWSTLSIRPPAPRRSLNRERSNSRRAGPTAPWPCRLFSSPARAPCRIC